MKRLAWEWLTSTLTSKPMELKEHPSFPENTLQRKLGTLWLCPINSLGVEIEGFDRKVCPILKWHRPTRKFRSSTGYPKMEWKNNGPAITCRFGIFCRKGLWDFMQMTGHGALVTLDNRVTMELNGTEISWGFDSGGL